MEQIEETLNIAELVRLECRVGLSLTSLEVEPSENSLAYFLTEVLRLKEFLEGCGNDSSAVTLLEFIAAFEQEISRPNFEVFSISEKWHVVIKQIHLIKIAAEKYDLNGDKSNPAWGTLNVSAVLKTVTARIKATAAATI
ncbi:MAG: hypothetical protein UT55_C0043G0008 [Candidatus Peregrinibacteria bacterium GW2011_GWE2_39_6]|nr:MAG: hypothetical protein UT36_C0008G0004 [Candidatus Peregrinibacteria bacterium GW2011_GWF2_39_17]KKR25484.1 MAG: hypothetical protein UT55_C0043G0008 [Candidatus Peregrinibacteria bacterium GW2011_GWE2_39_6]HCW32473.1 hypothetical protein [Candidatus Peregrinibacteria bacterium]